MFILSEYLKDDWSAKVPRHQISEKCGWNFGVEGTEQEGLCWWLVPVWQRRKLYLSYA